MGNIVKRDGRSITPLVRSSCPEIPAPADMAPHYATEVVSDEEVRQADQVRDAPTPKSFFRSTVFSDVPVVRGAKVKTEALAGFLSAIELMGEPGELDIFCLIQIDPDEGAVYLEAHVGGMWLVASLSAEVRIDATVRAMFPVRNAVNVLRHVAAYSEYVEVGADEEGVGLGPYTMRVSSAVSEFPSGPVLKPAKVRAAMPSSYPEEILTRLGWLSRGKLHDLSGSYILEFREDFSDPENGRYVMRMHGRSRNRMGRLDLSGIVVESNATFIGDSPRSVVVSGRFIQALAAVANKQWIGLEFAAGRIYARGEDYGILSSAVELDENETLKLREDKPVCDDSDVVVRRESFKKVLSAAAQAGLKIRLFVRRGFLCVSGVQEAGNIGTFEERIQATVCSGYPEDGHVEVVGYDLEAAVAGCGGSTVRIRFNGPGAWVISEDRLYAVKLTGDES